jgi:nickel-type superoxide dismutase maturation protease
MPSWRGRVRPLLLLSGAAIGSAGALALLRRVDVVEVHGGSMRPTLVPGDRLIVERWTFTRRSPRVGELVLASDPREPDRELVKRVAAVHGDAVELRGDARGASTDSRTFGGLPVERIRWRVAGRYWPPRRRPQS